METKQVKLNGRGHNRREGFEDTESITERQGKYVNFELLHVRFFK